MSHLGDWLEERTGWRTAARRWIDHPVVGGAPWASAMAASVATCFAVLALTGLTLMTAYGASPQAAWASVHYVQFVQGGGWVVRGLHYWAAQTLLVLAALHVLHGAFVASYRRPREVAWWLTLGVLGLAVAGGITGGLLPWDERGWWARTVEGNILGLAPGLGSWLQQMMAGGTELGALGLSRMLTLHTVVLPALLALMLWARRGIVNRQGWTEVATAPVSHLTQILRDGLVALGVVAVVFALAGAAHGAPLEAPADPMGDYPARPEWFLMTLYELRKLFHGAGEFFGTTLAPLAAGLYLALLPWLDRTGRPRAPLLAPVVLIFAGALLLGWIPVHKDAHDDAYQKQRAKADRRAAAAVRLAMGGVPPEGPLAMLRSDPELRGRDLFEQHCASCHVLGDLGDAKKATAAKLDGWGTAGWISAMIHEPDAPEFFGRGPFLGNMPSVDVRPQDKPADPPWKPMVSSEAERGVVATFLASQGDEPGDPWRAMDEAARATGERIVSNRCASCHLYKGDGDVNGSDVAPELAHYGSLAWTRAQIANPATVETYREKALGEDLKRHMPRFDKDLSTTDIDLVARWTRAHARGLSSP
jgi:ubiquinol-cytochrome c reductase cytochrome b subunit